MTHNRHGISSRHEQVTTFLRKIRDIIINSSSGINLLGVENDDELTFTDLLRNICCKGAKKRGLFMRVRNLMPMRAKLVYVIGLHAVQFGNNWMRKIPRTAKLDEAVGRVQFGSARNFFNPIITKLDKHVVLLPINYRASKNSLFKAKLNVRAKTIQFIVNWTIQLILNWTVCKN